MKLKVKIERTIEIDNKLYQYLKHKGLLQEFINETINSNPTKQYGLEHIVLNSTSSIKWIEVFEDFKTYTKEYSNQPFNIGNHELQC